MDIGLHLIVGVICGVICLAIASHKGRSMVGWFFLGFFFGLIPVIIVACLSNLNEQKQYRNYVEDQNRYLQEQLRQERLKSEAYRQHTLTRLDAHDQALGVDTRSSAQALAGPDRQQHLLTGGQSRPRQQWYYASNGETMGPVDYDQLVDLARQGVVQKSTLVWCSDMNDWTPAQSVSALQGELTR